MSLYVRDEGVPRVKIGAYPKRGPHGSFDREEHILGLLDSGPAYQDFFVEEPAQQTPQVA